MGSIILFRYVFDDLGYDRYHEKSDRICRISSRINPARSLRYE